MTNTNAISIRALTKSALAVSLLGCIALVSGGCASLGGHLASHRAVSALTVDGSLEATPKSLYAMARLLADQGKSAHAELVLTNLLHRHPGFLPAYCELAEIRLEQGRTDEAIYAIARGLEYGENDAVLLNNYGVCLLLKGAYGEALAKFEASLAVAPHDPRYRANKALALGLGGELSDSLSLYAAVLPEEDAFHNAYVILDMRSGNAKEADPQG